MKKSIKTLALALMALGLVTGCNINGNSSKPASSASSSGSSSQSQSSSSDSSSSSSSSSQVEEKVFIFNEEVGAAQFDNAYELVEKSVSTGETGENLETTISLQGGGNERLKSFGDEGYFVSTNLITINDPLFLITIGVNNPTSIGVTYGMLKDDDTTADEVRCEISVFNGDTQLDSVATSGDSGVGGDNTFTWTKKPSQETSANKIQIEVEGLHGSVHWREPLYIKSIELHWAY